MKLLQTEFLYSQQAVKLISALKDFDKDKFETEFFSKIIVGDRAITEYILTKDKNNIEVIK